MRVAFFSFHYQQDIWRVNYVRGAWYADSWEAVGFWDGSIEETHPTYNKKQIRNLINENLYGTSVTVVLIGKKTSYREWVKYEIEQSYKRNNGLLGIYIHKLLDKNNESDSKGNNPFEYVYDENNEPLSDYVPTYDWFSDTARDNIGSWIEEAAQSVGR